MFAVRPICVQDSIFKMSSESPESGTKPKLVAKILATNSADLLCKGHEGYQSW